MIVSQKFIDTRSGEIVEQILISEICHFEKYTGPLNAGDFDTTKAKQSEITGAHWLDIPFQWEGKP